MHLADIDVCLALASRYTAIWRRGGPASAGGFYGQLLADDRVSCLAEPLGLEQAWRRRTASDNYSLKVWQLRIWRPSR